MAQILRDIGHTDCLDPNPYQVKILGDNQEALALIKNPHLHERSKHIDICYHYTRDLEDKNRILISYIPTIKIIADSLTKPLTRPGFERFVQQLGMVMRNQTSVGVSTEGQWKSQHVLSGV